MLLLPHFCFFVGGVGLYSWIRQMATAYDFRSNRLFLAAAISLVFELSSCMQVFIAFHFISLVLKCRLNRQHLLMTITCNYFNAAPVFCLYSTLLFAQPECVRVWLLVLWQYWFLGWNSYLMCFLRENRRLVEVCHGLTCCLWAHFEEVQVKSKYHF